MLVFGIGQCIQCHHCTVHFLHINFFGTRRERSRFILGSNERKSIHHYGFKHKVIINNSCTYLIQVSFLFRLDYAAEEVELREKEMGAQSIYFMSHWIGGELKLYVLKGADQLQNLANVYVRLHSTEAFPVPKLCQTGEPLSVSASDHLRMDRLEAEIRKFQLLALQTWIKENGSIDLSTMNELLDQVALALAKNRNRFTVKALPEKTDWPEFSEADSLKWKLEKKKTTESENRPPTNNRLLQPNGRLISVDVNNILRCFNKKQPTRSPRKIRPENASTATDSQLKPTCDVQTARVTPWPESARLKFHGIKYIL